MKKKHSSLVTFEAIATMVGTIIGAGILGIPYALSQSGFLTGVLTLAAVGIVVVYLNLFVGEIVLRTREPRQLPGYAAYFLGPWAKHVFAVMMIFGIFGALIAYIIGVGESLHALFDGPSVYWGALFVALVAYPIYRGVNMIKSFELIMLAIIFVIIAVIAMMSNGHIHYENLMQPFDYSKLFVPYGVALFAFGGMSAVRPVREILDGQEKKLKKVIIISSVIPLVVYIFFAFVVVGVTGSATTEIATVGLGNVVGPSLIALGNLFAIFAMGTSFLTMSLILKETLDFDYNMPSKIAWGLTVFVPLLVYILGVHSFISVLSWVGAIGGGVQGILIVLMYWKSDHRGNRKPEYDVPQHYIIGSILIIMFIVGIWMTIAQ